QSGQAEFTAAQAATGAEVYQSACATCHLPTLQGSGEARELAGPNFRAAWGGRTATELLDYVRGTMPPANPRSLSDAEYAAVVAYVLSQNGVAAGQTALGPSSPGLAVAAAGGAAQVAAAVYPVPGRPGNTPSPHGVNRVP